MLIDQHGPVVAMTFAGTYPASEPEKSAHLKLVICLAEQPEGGLC